MKKNGILLRTLFFISVVYILLSTCLMAMNSSYTVYAGEDFVHANQIRACGGVLPYLKYMCFNWQGSYTSELLEALISPLVHGGYEILRAIMVGNVVLTVSSLYWMVYTVFHVNSSDKLYQATWTGASIFFMMMNYRGYPEVFTHFSGAVYYSIPLSIGVIGICCFMWACRGVHRPLNTILAAILIFLGCGGSMVVTGVLATVVLSVCIYYIFRRRIKGWIIVIFLVTLAGGLLNALAPGNFIHQEQITQELRPFAAFVYTYTIARDNLINMFMSPFARLMAVMGVAIGSEMRFKKSDPLAIWGMFTLLAILLGFIAIYPLALAYGSAFIPNRACFILDSIFLLVILNMAMCIGGWIGFACRRLRFPIYPIFLFFFAVQCWFSRQAFPVSYQMSMGKSLYKGEGAKYVAEVHRVFDAAVHSNDNLVISSLPKAPPTIYGFELSSLEENTSNVEIAQYFGIESIVLDTSN